MMKLRLSALLPIGLALGTSLVSTMPAWGYLPYDLTEAQNYYYDINAEGRPDGIIYCYTVCDLSNAPLSNADLSGIRRVTYGNLSSVNLSNATNLISTDGQGFNRTYLGGANLTGANLTDADFIYADLTNANLTNANLTGIALLFPRMSNADLSYANLTNANLIGGNLSYANLSYAIVKGANFNGANLTGAILNYIDPLEPPDFTGAFLDDVSAISPDLTNANFTGASFTNAKFNGGTLAGANFTGADITGGNFNGVNLLGATISPSQLSSLASFSGTLPDGTVVVAATSVPESSNVVGMVVVGLMGLVGVKERKKS